MLHLCASSRAHRVTGWFPKFVINSAIGGSYVTFFEDLQGALERQGWQGRVK